MIVWKHAVLNATLADVAGLDEHWHRREIIDVDRPLVDHGWVSLRTDTKLNWKEIEELVRGSYEQVSAKKRRR